MLRISLDNLLKVDLTKYEAYLCFGNRYEYKTIELESYKIVKENTKYYILIDDIYTNIITISFVDKSVNKAIFTLDIDNGCHYIEKANFVIKARLNKIEEKALKMYQIFQFLIKNN